MDYKKLMKSRKSTRAYKDDKIDKKDMATLQHYFHNCKRLIPDIELEFVFFEDGKNVYNKLDGIAGYNGRMIQAPGYLIILSEVKGGYIENTGFVVESTILKAEELGIDTCWITFSDSNTIKKRLGVTNENEITAIVALGYGLDQKKVLNVLNTGDNYSKANMSVVQDNTSFRYAVEDFVYDKEWGNEISYQALEMRGLGDTFTYARLAPSTLNSQPWKFILDDSRLILAIKDGIHISQRDEQTDAGIVMLYVYLVFAETVYDLKWQLGQPNKKYKIPKDYRIVAWCTM